MGKTEIEKRKKITSQEIEKYETMKDYIDPIQREDIERIIKNNLNHVPIID